MLLDKHVGNQKCILCYLSIFRGRKAFFLFSCSVFRNELPAFCDRGAKASKCTAFLFVFMKQRMPMQCIRLREHKGKGH